MSIVNGLFSWAIQHPGHLAKVYQGVNDSRGIVLHSAEGYLPALLNLVQSFDRKASWTGSIALDGRLYQHYPVTARCWASGNAAANRMYWSFELEGVRGNPANEAQVAALLRIADEFETFTGMKATRQIAGPRTLFEHNEVAQIATPNAGPTACPSGRYAPFYAALERRQQPTVQEADMTEEEVREIARQEAEKAFTRLNDAIGARNRLIHLASDMDRYADVQQANEVLKEEGILE